MRPSFIVREAVPQSSHGIGQGTGSEGRGMRKKRAMVVLAVILIAIAAVLLINREATRVVFCNLFAGSESLDDSVEWDGGTSYERLPYAGQSQAQYLHLYVPKSDEPMPLLILIHGGGFYFNDNESRQAQFMYRYFRDHGYACASVNYRLGDEAAYPAALEDVKAAIRFLRANAGRYGYDADRFAVWGESAGGYLAVMAGVTDDSEFSALPFIGEEECDAPVSAQVSVILDYYGATELGAKESGYGDLGIPKFILNLAGMWLRPALEATGFDNVESAWLRRDTSQMAREELDKINPAYYIQKNLNADSELYVIIRHGDADLDVPYTQSERIGRLFGDVIGPSKVNLEIVRNYKHASDRFYSDAALAEVKGLMDQYFGR